MGSVLAGLIFAAPALAAPVYSSVDLNLRTGPGEQYPILAVLAKNDEGNASKVFQLGGQTMSWQAGARYYLEAPDGGPDWGLRSTLTLLFPSQ